METNQDLTNKTRQSSPSKTLHELVSHQIVTVEKSIEKRNNQNIIDCIENREEEESNENLSQALKEAGVSPLGKSKKKKKRKTCGDKPVRSNPVRAGRTILK